jgi:predicted amidohydrolase
MDLKVSGAQLAVTEDIDQNIQDITDAIDKAGGQGSDILLTPEGSLSGYTPKFDRGQVEAGLETVTGHAKALGVGLALGTCYIEPDDQCYNQIRFYAKDGAYLGFHSKILRCGSMEAEPRGEINNYAATDLRTFEFEGVTIGGLICNDFWANPCCTPVPDPNLTHQLSDMGARVIFQAVNGGRDGSPWARDVVWPFHESNLLMRTRADGLWTVVADSAHPLAHPCSCPSGVVSPEGRWATQANRRGADQFTYTIDLSSEEDNH